MYEHVRVSSPDHTQEKIMNRDKRNAKRRFEYELKKKYERAGIKDPSCLWDNCDPDEIESRRMGNLTRGAILPDCLKGD